MGLNLRPKGKGGPRGLTDTQLAEALRKNVGNVLAAAQALGVTEGAIYQRLRHHPELAQIQADARDRVTDMAKARVLKRIERDDWPAINLWLTTQAGWTKRTELTGLDGAPLQPQKLDVTVSYVDPQPRADETEEPL